jgi:hypothetical protein
MKSIIPLSLFASALNAAQPTHAVLSSFGCVPGEHVKHWAPLGPYALIPWSWQDSQ